MLLLKLNTILVGRSDVILCAYAKLICLLYVNGTKFLQYSCRNFSSGRVCTQPGSCNAQISHEKFSIAVVLIIERDINILWNTERVGWAAAAA